LVALLGMAAAGALLLRTWPTLPMVVVDGTPGPSGSPAPSASPAPVWQSATIPPMFDVGSSTPVAVAAGDPGFAAVGGRAFRDSGTPSGGTASAWRSLDGRTWEPATADEGLAVGDEIRVDDYPPPGLVDVTWGPGGFVAVGIALTPSERVGGTWHSSDGLAWARAELPEPARARPAAVTWNGSTYVIVGVVEEEGSPRAAAWLSADGRSWRRVPDGDAFDIGGYITYPAAIGSGGPADVTTAPDGSLIAVGRTCAGTTSMEEQAVCSPFAMRSDSGETWTRVSVPTDSGVVLSSVAAIGTRTVAVAGAVGETADPARVIVGDDAGWRLVEPAGVPRLDRVVAFGEGYLALSTAASEISLWTSTDGEAWTAVPGVPQPPYVTVLLEVDLAVAGTEVVIVGGAELSSAAGAGGFAIVGSPRQPQPAPQTPNASSSPSALPSPVAGTLPVASGTVRMAPGPDGGAYVLVSTGGDAMSGRAGRTVLALLDAAGNPRSGWPIAVDGWICDNPNGSAWPPETAGDGTATVVCRSDEGSDGSVRTSAIRFDAAGGLVASWAYDGEVFGRPRIVDGHLLLIAAEVTEQKVTAPGGQVETRSVVVHWLKEVAEDGTIRSGARVEMGDAGWHVVMGPDGTAYHENMADGVVTAFDMDGQRAGWPVRLDGALSALGFGPDGRVFVTVSSAGTARLFVLGRNGEIVARSDPLPVAGARASSGAGPDGRPLAPLVAADGTAFVIGEADGHGVVYRIDPSL
ncbi:MAG: hypothetical protein ABIG85_04750, partial [Chloroflexota bacterium]